MLVALAKVIEHLPTVLIIVEPVIAGACETLLSCGRHGPLVKI